MGSDEIRAALKMPAWEARGLRASGSFVPLPLLRHSFFFLDQPREETLATQVTSAVEKEPEKFRLDRESKFSFIHALPFIKCSF